MSESEPVVNSERLQATSRRFQMTIVSGIAEAYAGQREISSSTARAIARVLGRALGRASALAEFGRTGEGTYEVLSEEYLRLYTEPTTPPMIKEWIDWLGTYLVEANAEGSGRQFMNEHAAPRLDRLLVRTELTVNGTQYLMYAPATLTGPHYQDLAKRLGQKGLATRPALQAFLLLRDVNADDENLEESFEETFVADFDDIKDALYQLSELAEWERDLADFAKERGLDGAVFVDHSVVESRTREVFDVVAHAGRIYALYR
jgi:hypothetical protein